VPTFSPLHTHARHTTHDTHARARHATHTHDDDDDDDDDTQVEEFEAFLERASKGWGLEALTQVVELVVGLCDETKQDPLVIDADTIAVAEEDLNRFPAIRNQNLSLADIRVRFTAVRLFNRQLTVVLPLVDFSQTHLSWSLAHSVCKLTGTHRPLC
jgi:hypothetical protein